MNEEELFCKLFPEYVVNGKPLSPYFDLFESGYEQAENRIAELETRCNELFLQTIQLTNAKEIIKEFVEWANWQGNSKCPSFKSIQDKAERFLKDSEVEK